MFQVVCGLLMIGADSTSQQVSDVLWWVSDLSVYLSLFSIPQRSGLVDGNVIRVLCRLRMIGADSTSQQVNDVLW